jgi:transcription initiation factor TFIIB
MITACLYYLCKIKNIPRTFKEILNESSLNSKQFRQNYNCLVKELKLKVPIHNPIANIPRFIANLGLGFEVEKITIKILEEYLKNNSLKGENPNGICGGAIYLASKFYQKRIGQKRIADIVGVTDSTLRARYYDIINGINLRILNKNGD